jgi:hypothetical protein
MKAVMWNIRIDSATGEVVRVLDSRGIRSVILKGPAFSEWYPADSARTYVDGDVWVAPDDVSRAELVLHDLGYVPTRDELGLPRWWVGHSSGWARQSDKGKIDLHRMLQGTGADPQQVWDLLWPRTVDFTVGGQPARRLPESARALYAALHAIGHGADHDYSNGHLRAALSAVDDQTWEAALALAAELGAIDAFAAGIRLTPEGVALAGRIGVPESRSVVNALMSASLPPVALGFEEILAAGWLERAHILVRKLVPPPGFIRLWWPPANQNGVFLIVGYLYRPLWLLVRAPAGYRAWRAARRAVKSSS